MTNYRIKILSIFLMPLCLFAQTAKFNEYEVKAAFLEKFTRFIEWPKEVHLEDLNKPFIIAVIGENPFSSILNNMYAKLKIKNKKVEIRYISTVEEITDCNILFISESEKARIKHIISHTEKKPILTISDEKNFSKKGILITLYVKSSHISFEVNSNAVHNAGLYMSSLLLNLSKAISKEDK